MAPSPAEAADAAAIVSARLADCYGVTAAHLAFVGGELDRNYRVEASDGAAYLAKLRTKIDLNSQLQWQKDILLHVADRELGVAVPTLVRTIDGELDVGIAVGAERWLLTVLNWVPGTDMVHVDKHSKELLFEIGATAARVTHALKGFHSEGMHKTHHWDIARSAEVIVTCLVSDPTLGENPDVNTALRWFRNIEPVLGSLPRAMVHNDLNDNNILVGDRDGVQKVTGVLDFNDALYTVRVAEPAIAGAYAMLRKDDPLTAMGWVVAGYHDVTPLTDDELAVAYPLAATRLCVQALTWAVRGQSDPTAYGAMRMRHTLPALKRVLQVNPAKAAAHLLAMRGQRPSLREHSSRSARLLAKHQGEALSSKTMHMANAFDGSGLDELDSAAQALIHRRDKVLAPSYRLFYRHPVVAVRGSGVWLYDAQGNQYLDAYNNVPAVGHSHPHVQRLVNEALGVLNTHTRYLTEPVISYSERLLGLFPPELTKVVYTCTGSEAVDLALRMARYETGAEGIICTSHAYHGTTSAAAQISPSLGSNNRIGPSVALVAAPDGRRDSAETVADDFADRVRAAITELRERGAGFAGMIVDSIMSSDGVVSDPVGLLAPAAQAVREAGGLWIADEVQPGFGRMGSVWWGFQRHDLVPDLVALGKPMGNGVPIGAVVGREEVMARFGRDIRYFNTFGGNPVSIAAATAVLDVIDSEHLLDSVQRAGQRLLDGLGEIAGRHAGVGGVRGTGLFTALEFVDADGDSPDAARASRVVNELRDRRILISASGPHENVLKIRPPLPFTTEHADRLLSELDDVLVHTPAR